MMNRSALSALLVLTLACVSTLSHANVDPQLIGVWRTSDTVPIRTEFYADGTISNWIEKKFDRRGGALSKRLVVKDYKKKLTLIDENHFQIGEGDSSGRFHYKITLRNPGSPPNQHSYTLVFNPVGKENIKFTTRKVNFQKSDHLRTVGDYQTHKNLSFEALVTHYMKLGDHKEVNRLLSSDDAAFLKAPQTKLAIRQGRNMLMSRLWNQAAETHNADLIRVFYKNLPEGYRAGHLNQAMQDNKQEIVKLYKELTRVKASALNEDEKNQLQFVLKSYQLLIDKALYRDHLVGNGFGCRKVKIDYAAVNRMNMGEKPDPVTQERLDWGKKQMEKNAQDWENYIALVEREFRYCLEHGSHLGPITSKIINSRTTPGDKVSYATTPLYHYASFRYPSYGGNRVNAFAETAIRYAAMNVLLDMGADPDIKPTDNELPLSEYMLLHADHKNFERAARDTRMRPTEPAKRNLQKFNAVMQRIGGQAYEVAKLNLPKPTNSEKKRSVSSIPKPSQTKKPLTPTKTTRPKITSAWEMVGFWSYDGIDAQQLPFGLVLKKQAGSVAGFAWDMQLELVNHNKLPKRKRLLFPVKINRKEKKVCIDAPYPTLTANIDLPGSKFDGEYTLASCKGGR